MSERERWIVYPLLFLALGAALRDKLSEQTRTKHIECQELVVYGEDRPGQPPVPLVQIGAMQRSNGGAPHLGQIVINGQLVAQGVQAESIETRHINADNYFYHRLPFNPLLKSIPGVWPTDWLRALQLSAEALDEKAESPPTTDEKLKPSAE